MKKTLGRLTLEARPSRGVFALFAALNAMGYDNENNARGMHPARRKIRKALAGYNWNEKYPLLKRVFNAYHPWHLLKAILAKPRKVKRTPMLARFIQDLRNFSSEPLVRKLWKAFRNYQGGEAKKLFPLFERETIRLIAFINRPPRGITKIALTVNPLDAYWSGYGLTVGEIGYIVAGPGARKNQGGLMRHELLHILAPALQFPAPPAIGRNYRRLAAMGYGSQRIINHEYAVRSLGLLYESMILKRDISRDIKREARDFPHIRKALAFVKSKKEKGRL